MTVTDAAGAQRSAPLFYVSPGQINYLVPEGTAVGAAQLTVTNGAGLKGQVSVAVASLAPAIFQLNSSGLAAAVVLIFGSNNTQTFRDIYQLDSSNLVVPLPIDLGSGQIYLELYGTGIRNGKQVTCTAGGQNVPVLFAGAQGDFLGLDQVNIGPLPQSLKGKGPVNIVLTADGQAANIVNVTVQ